jgi:hypothetical protein
MKQPHSKMLDIAAKRHLAPHGFIQQGRSRTWLNDQRWYAIVVEFQPSSFSKGSHLNVGAHFLWSSSDHLSFDLGYRVERFMQFKSEEQFAPHADRLATTAVTEAHRLRALLPDVHGATTSIPADSEGWSCYHRAIALGLIGNAQEASAGFGRLTNPSTQIPWQVELATRCIDFQRLLTNPNEFQASIAGLIAQHRQVLRLPEIGEPLADADLVPRASTAAP